MFTAEIYRDYPRPPFSLVLRKEYFDCLTVFRETLTQYITCNRGERWESICIMGRRPLLDVRDFTRDGRWSTHDESVRKKMGGGGGKCTQTGCPLKLPSPTNLARLGHFPPASQVGRLAGPLFYVYVFSLVCTVLSVLCSLATLVVLHRPLCEE
jgi:hypothetical protein